MGADIYGWVETWDAANEQWDAVVLIDHLVYRQYGMLVSLFGFRNGGPTPSENGRFRAIAAARGAPPSASPRYLDNRGDLDWVIGETWVLWRELAAIDWDEEGAYCIGDDPPHYVCGDPGPGRRWERRSDYRNNGWATLFNLMATLAKQFGEDHVRLSIWFDQG